MAGAPRTRASARTKKVVAVPSAAAPPPERYLSTNGGFWRVIGRGGMPECRDGLLLEALHSYLRGAFALGLTPPREAATPVWHGASAAFMTLETYERRYVCGADPCTAEAVWTDPLGTSWCATHRNHGPYSPPPGAS